MSDPQVLTSLEHALLRSDRAMALTITSFGTMCIYLHLVPNPSSFRHMLNLLLAIHVHTLLDTSDSTWLSLK